MIRILIIALISIWLTNFGRAAEFNEGIYHQEDSSEYLYEFDMRYIGSSTSIDINYRYVLEYLIELLCKNPTWTLHIRGHVCCGPSERISVKRAKKVYNFLKRSGIHESRLSYKGYSDQIPLAFPEKTEEDEAMNRRVDFIIRR